MIWQSSGTSLKNQTIKVIFNFQFQKDIIKLELKFLGMNLLNTFYFVGVLLLWTNSYIYSLNHIYNAAWWGFTW